MLLLCICAAFYGLLLGVFIVDCLPIDGPALSLFYYDLTPCVEFEDSVFLLSKLTLFDSRGCSLWLLGAFNLNS